MGATEKVDLSKEEQLGNTDRKRTTWSNPLEFILTLIGFAVGLGNVWRFPYLCYKNGGGAFLIPYTICLFVLGIPLFCLEINFGQFASLGPVKAWAINPAMRGVGFAMAVTIGIISLYYSVVICYCFYYLFASMTSKLPWNYCDNDFNTCNCRVSTATNSSLNDSRPECNGTIGTSSSTHEYFYINVLNMSNGIEEAGPVKWDVTLCNLLVWIIVWLVLSKGVKSLGKVMYFATIFPYVMLTVLLIKGVTMEGYKDGLYYYLRTDFSRLSDANVWGDAATQIFFSLGTCMGGLIALGSYNKFSHNSLRDSFLVPIVNGLTSLYAGLAIFAVLGHMAYKQNKPVSEVATGGPGLIFEVYPEGLAEMPFPPIWCVLFFFMMAILGLSSQFSGVEAYLTSIEDYMPHAHNTRTKKIMIRGFVCFIGFLLGLPMVTNGGFYILNLLDTQMSGFPLLFIGLFESIAISYIYGIQFFVRDIEIMLGRNLFTVISLFYFRICWVLLTPLCLLATIIFKIWQFQPMSMGTYVYPDWAQALGWLMTLFPILFIPVWFVGVAIQNGLWQFCRDMNTPQPEWQPLKYENRVGTPYEELELNVRNKTPRIRTVSTMSHDNNGYIPEEMTIDKNGYVVNQ